MYSLPNVYICHTRVKSQGICLISRAKYSTRVEWMFHSCKVFMDLEPCPILM